MKKEKWSKRHSSGFRKWLITVLLAISVLMTGYSVLKETGDVLLDQAKAWMEEGIDGARDEAGDDGDVASDKKCGGTSAAETPEDGFWGTEIPVYQGKAWIELNNNVPLFTKKDYSTKSFETYGELDSLGRCTTAYANVGQDLMPTKERESISQVKPTGWQKSEYDGIDGKFLYNRCHLIGYQLTAENANEKNLITGTRYLNVTGMLPFENMVADVAFQPKINVWNNETSVQLQAVSIHQQVTLGDMRQDADDKWRLLLGLVKVHNKVLAYTEDKQSLPAEVLQTAGDYLELASYEEAAGMSQERLQQAEEIVLLDLPAYPLADIMRRLRQQGAKHVTLLFNQPDLEERLQRLALTHPDRDAMMQAYKLVMNALKMRTTVSVEELLSAHAEQISEQAVKIMEELGFISYNNGIIEKAAIKRCSLEDAPLYVTLQQERERLEHIYKENYRLSQHELLRC